MYCTELCQIHLVYALGAGFNVTAVTRHYIERSGTTMVMVLFAMLGLVNISLATLSSWLDPVKVNRIAIEKAVKAEQHYLECRSRCDMISDPLEEHEETIPSNWVQKC